MTGDRPKVGATRAGGVAVGAPTRAHGTTRLRRFMPYRAYKNSGVEWLGEIPTHWEISRLSEVATLINGYPFDSEFFVRGDGTSLVRIRDLNSTETEVNYIGPVIQNAWIVNGDVIVGMDGDFNVARWRGQRALLNQRMCCLRPRGGFDSGFIAYLLPLPLRVINDLTYSTTVKHLSSVDVRKIRLGLPGHEEQCAIAAFLDSETRRTDELVAKEERLMELLQEQRAALITRTVTKGLASNASTKDSGVEWLGNVPANWEIARLSEIATLLNGYPFDSEFFVRSDGAPLVRIRDLNSTETEVNYIGPVMQNAWIDHGDVIVGMDGDFNVARWRGQRALLNQRMCCLRPRRNFDAGFISYLLPTPLKVINDLTYSTTVKHLSSADVRKIRLGAPGREEQRAIVAFLERETTRIDALVARVRDAIDRLKEFRTAFIFAAVTGKIDVREEVA
jgi:type I restriction enzyme, S subunit